jgi:uncharacterized protein YbaR (Trm112 family)
MSIIVNPDNFTVPYAIGDDGRLYQIRDGKPLCDSLACPICRGPVSFVREITQRAAHFRHRSRADCDALAAYHRKTLHDAVRDAAAALASGQHGAKGICQGFTGALPRGAVTIEKTNALGTWTYRPDVTIEPAAGQYAPILELEVVFSHKPSERRLTEAATQGRIIGILDIAAIERDYYRKLWAGEAFDIPQACREFVIANRFTILTTADVRRAISGILDRQYKAATVRAEHAAIPRMEPAPDLPAAGPTTWRGKPGGRVLPAHPKTCAVCGVSDWLVTMTERDGKTVHVGCSTLARKPVDSAVDSAVDRTNEK